MWKDPIVEEVRAIREKQAKAFDFDIRKIVADAEVRQRASGHRLASFIESGPAHPVRHKHPQP